ncbi:hypothetical protein ACIRBX_31505 [Kitasatospora sp. NPDC096147]|uniref:hypothetical protein n=1 Tax=Kitasatospora sp. NPDC096147 TaxID=3364093 RepID=UPI00380A6358
MSRGRHRHSSLLGRIGPPAAAGVLVLAALASLVASGDTLTIRSLGVAAVLATVGVTLLLRQRDRAARLAAELAATRRLRAEERFEEQLAEAEYAAEVAEERATRFGRRLTAEKSRLAKAETEIARLLRERAVMVAEQALKEAEAHQRALAAARPKYPASPAAYVRAASVLRQLEREAVRAEERRAAAERAAAAKRPPALPAADAPAPAAKPVQATVRQLGAVPERPVLTAPGAASEGAAPVVRQRPRPAARQNFSFFGRPGAAGAAVRAAAPAPSVGSVTELAAKAPVAPIAPAVPAAVAAAGPELVDLADVVGDEAVAESARYAAPQPVVEEPLTAAPEEPTDAHRRPEVVDLTPHDDTEAISVAALRAEFSQER